MDKPKSISIKVSFFGDYKKDIFKESDKFAAMCDFFLKKEYIPNTIQEVSLQIKVNRSSGQMEEAREQGKRLRPSFVSQDGIKSVTIGSERLDIEYNDSSFEADIWEDISQIANKISEIFSKKQQRIGIVLCSKYDGEIQKCKIEKDGLFSVINNGTDDILNCVFETVKQRKVCIGELGDKLINIVMKLQLPSKSINEIVFYIDANTDAKNKELMFDINHAKHLWDIVKREKEHIESVIIDGNN